MRRHSLVIAVLMASTFLSAPAWADWTPDEKEGAAYSIVAGTEDDYNFTTTDGENTSYWKINLNANNFSTQDSITWSTDSTDSTGSVDIQLPNSDTPTTLYYTYTMPEGYTETNTRLTSITEEDVTSKVFKDINTGSNNAGSVYISSQDYSNINVISDFTGNVFLSGGGLAASVSSLGEVLGSFINNYASTSGGAIEANDSVFGNIIGDFIGNNTGHFGGAIRTQNSTFDNITGNFIGNYAQSNSNAWGGAIDAIAGSYFGDILGNFIVIENAYLVLYSLTMLKAG